MAPFDELERRLAFSDTAVAQQQDSDSGNLHKHSVDGFLGGKHVGQRSNDSNGEIRRVEVGQKNRNLMDSAR